MASRSPRDERPLTPPADKHLLTDYLGNVYAKFRQISRDSVWQMTNSCNKFSKFLQRPAVLSDLTDDNVSQFIVSLEGVRAPRTIRNHRMTLMQVWRDAVYHGELSDGPKRIRKVKVPRRAVKAWTMQEWQRLIATCKSYPKKLMFQGVEYGDYLEALLLTAYETGLRRGDLWTLPREQIRQDGCIFITLQKTGEAHPCMLSKGTLAKVLALPGAVPLMWPYSRHHFYDVIFKLCQLADVPYGALHHARRTGATMLYRQNPELAKKYLGHLTPDMWRSYVDRSQTGEAVQPPSTFEQIPRVKPLTTKAKRQPRVIRRKSR